MSEYLLDTNILVDVIRRRQDKVDLLQQLLLSGSNLSCSTITIAEIYAGMRPHEKARTEKLFVALGYYNVTPAVAAYGGLLKNEWASKGRTLSITDTLIAATAIVHKCVLITENLKDFPMPELRLFPLSS